MKKSETKNLIKEHNTGIFLEERNKVEALLFAYGKYIDESMISELCNIDRKIIKKILDSLKKEYEEKNSALMIFQEGNSWKINVREKYLSIVRKIVADTELPKSVMETLAVIAWKTPIYQAEVVKIRGNKCYDHIDMLEETGFISKEKKGRSYILKTTEKFYNYFEIDDGNLKSIFEEVKTPLNVKEEQRKLNEQILIPENLEIDKKIEEIELKKLTETEEEIIEKKSFLEKIESKIIEIKQKNEIFEKEIPSIRNETMNKENVSEKNNDEENKKEYKNTYNKESSDEERPENTLHNRKKLTKKQLEKKFKEELQRVKQKIELK